MTDNQVIHRLKSIPLYSSSMEKLTVAPLELSDEEKTYLLTSALILIKKYEKDKRCFSYAELSYYIILKYALAFNDYEPLYDFCVNFGFYPIAQVITTEKLIEFENISFSLIQKRISANYSKDRLVRTLEQKRTHEILLESEEKEISFVAPTSYGKSSVIIERISANLNHEKRAAIIVPTKSLLMQTYRYVRSANLGVKILIHDEMFEGENSFVAVLTQERALRMMDKKNACFDALYIDEAHRLEEDFISYKLHMFFQLMYDYGVLSYDEYNQIIYGTTDAVKLTLVKMGLTINLINRLDEDGQLGNLAVDEQNNVQVNDAFETYKAGVDDFYRFELNRLL